MTNLGKEDTISIGHPAMCARHDIILSGYIKTNVITLGNMSQSSYLTEIQIWLVPGCLRLRMPEKKRCDTIWWDDIVRFSGNELWERVQNKSSSLNQGEDGEVADGINDNSSRLTKDGFPQLFEQGDNICQIKWYNDVCSRKTYKIKHWLNGAPEIWVGLHGQC